MTLTKIGASLSGGADVIHITHASHPFTVGQVLRSSGSAGVYTTAQADSAANAEVIGIVVQDIDTNTYAMALSGRITADGVVPVATAGTVLFLSPTSAGALTTTEPTTTGQISKPIGVVTTSNLEMIMINYRGEVVATSTESWDVNGSELILDVDGDTSLHADTDDQIDVQIAGADDFRFTANTLSILSGSTLAIDSGATLANSGTLTGFNSNSFTVTQASHGLAVGNVVKASGNSTFAKAQANTAANAEVVGVVTVVSGNDITITTSGEITVAAAVPNVAAGTVVFLHEGGSSDEGTLTATEPSTDDQISKPVAIVTHQNSKMVLLPFRGEILGTGAQSVADDSITLAKMAGGTDGNLITYDTSGNPAYVATGTATHVLTSNGADTVPTFQAAGGGNLVLINTATASSSSTLEVTGLSSTYESYLIVASYIRPSSDGPVFQLRFGDSGAIDSGASDYAYHVARINSGSGSYAASVSAGTTHIQVCPSGTDNAADSSFGMVGWLHGNGSVQPIISGETTYVQADDTSVVYGGHFVGKRHAAMVVTRVELSPSTGTFTSGRLTVWGLKHA